MSIEIALNKSNWLFISPTTGAIDIIPTKILEEMSAEEKDYLVRRGHFLIEEEKGEKLKSLWNIRQQKDHNIPYWFYIPTTFNCNFGCPICYEKQILNNSEMTAETLENAIRAINDFQGQRVIPSNKINLIIFGGEPLCLSNPDIIRQILATATHYGWKVIIVSNGSRVAKFINLFSEYAKTISDFRITIDGPQTIHDSRRPYGGGQESFADVVEAIDLLLENNFLVKMQTVIGSGNIAYFEDLIAFIKEKGWLRNPFFEWRIEGSHDYANLDPEKDEISEAQIVQKLIYSRDSNQELPGKMKFESFKYLGHIVRSFGWLGNYNTYWGPKYNFCEPQRGFHYVFSTNGKIYHCPRTINNPEFCLGNADEGLARNNDLKQQTILDKTKCVSCEINTLCGGGCVVQKKFYPDLACKDYALSIIIEFIALMTDKILERAVPDKIVSINSLW
jgi:uncharacterized protein